MRTTNSHFEGKATSVPGYVLASRHHRGSWLKWAATAKRRNDADKRDRARNGAMSDERQPQAPLITGRRAGVFAARLTNVAADVSALAESGLGAADDPLGPTPPTPQDRGQRLRPYQGRRLPCHPPDLSV